MSIKPVWDKTSGYKTASAGVLLLLFQLFKLIWPNVVPIHWEEFVYNAIGVIGATGVIDKIVRNRKAIAKFFKSLFTKDKKEGKDGA